MTPVMKSLILLFVIIGGILAAGCTTPAAPKADPWVIPADKYVFIDRHISRSGEVLNGTCGGGMMIDFPMYSFNRGTGELSGMSAREIVVNDSLKIVYGDGVSLGGALGGGASTYLTPVYALPFETGRVRITGVSPEGLLVMANGNETIALPAGETWTNTTTSITRDFPGSDDTCTIMVTAKETIYNAGILAKNGIRADG